MAYSELQQRHDIVARHRENRGRMASVSATFDTAGAGVVEFEDAIDFGVTFIDQPRIHYGSYCDAQDLRDAAGLIDGDPLPLPTCSGSAVGWDQDENDHYIGAWVAVKVLSDTLIDGLPVTHHFDFTGIALKVIPNDPTD
jgi:hypothetical protein